MQEILEAIMILTPWITMYAVIYTGERNKSKKIRKSLDF